MAFGPIRNQSVVYLTTYGKGLVQYEAVVDQWPAYSSILCRPTKECQHDFGLFVYTTNTHTLNTLLMQHVNWTTGIMFASCPMHSWDAVKAVGKMKGFNSIFTVCNIFTYKELWQNMAKRRVPHDLTLDSCNESDAETISKHWEYSKGESTVNLIKYTIQNLPSACVRTRDGRPVAWALQELDGQIGMGHTLPEFRRMYLNQTVFQEVLLQISQDGGPRFAYTQEDNTPSIINQHKYHGTEKYDAKVAWIDVTLTDSKL